MFWRPSVQDVSDWFAATCLQFVQQENTNPRRSASDFLQRYVFCDTYEIFFGRFHIELHQWLSRLTERRTNFQNRRIHAWTPARVNLVKNVNNEVSHAVDFWTTRTLEAFVTEFAIDTSTSFSEAERQFFTGPRGKFLNSLSLKIKILLVEKGILLFESDC